MGAGILKHFCSNTLRDVIFMGIQKDLLAMADEVLAALTSCSIEEERLSAWVLDDHDRAVVVLKTARDLCRPPSSTVTFSACTA